MKNRKFMLAAEALTSGILLAVFGKLTGDYVTLALGIVGSFHAADTLITRKSLETPK
jgi:hypothetical protein